MIEKLLQEEGGKASYRYMNDAQKKQIRDEIVKVEPFSTNRERVEYFDKPRGVFSGLTVEQIERFLTRNKDAYRRNSPHRTRNEEKHLEAEKMDFDLVEEGFLEVHDSFSEIGTLEIGRVVCATGIEAVVEDGELSKVSDSVEDWIGDLNRDLGGGFAAPGAGYGREESAANVAEDMRGESVACGSGEMRGESDPTGAGVWIGESAAADVWRGESVSTGASGGDEGASDC